MGYNHSHGVIFISLDSIRVSKLIKIRPKIQQQKRKHEKSMQISITEGELQIANSHLKRCSTSLVTKEIS